ncbi:MAG: hypothetical protein RML94_16750 [Bacteroidia bacterium]|nr:hypothetical protein [Bacteroidia bacterium]
MRSAAKHRSVSVARSTPTRAQRRDTPKIKLKIILKLNSNPNIQIKYHALPCFNYKIQKHDAIKLK